MMWMDVDTALAEVPVNTVPLTDDADFKSPEESVAYNAAGMELIWHFTTTAGATSASVVTPTTGGAYDWAHQDGAMYTIEIPASGGASINNDTEGFGYFTGKATGVLPWRGPTIGFRAAALNNALIDSAWSATRGLAGTALPDAAADAAGGLPISDAGALDLDTNLGVLVNGTYGNSALNTKLNPISNLDAAVTTRQATYAGISNLDMALSSVNTQVAAIGTHTARLDALLENSSGDRFKAKALETAPNTTTGIVLDSAYDPAKTAAQETTLNTKIPTALSFTGANVNAESKVTAAPTGMSTLAAGAQMDLVNAPNATAVTAIQAGLSKPGTAQTITAPADMASQATLLLTKTAADNAASAAALAAPATTALSTAVWTNTKAGYLDAAVSSASAPTVQQIDAQLSSTHGAGAWGSGATGVRTITINAQLANTTSVGNVHVAIYNNGTFVKDLTLNSGGTGTTKLDDGTFEFRGFLPLYTITTTTQTISADATVTLVCAKAAEPVPTAGIQIMRISARNMGGVWDATARVQAMRIAENTTIGGATITRYVSGVANAETQTIDIALVKGAQCRITGTADGKTFLDGTITVSSADVTTPEDYTELA